MMNDDEEDEELEETDLYEFVATGEKSCERCMALAGSQWAEPPSLPHAHCACEVNVVPKGVHRPRDCDDTTWSVEQIPGGAVTYGPAGDESFEWGFNVTVDCWDGGTHEFEIWVDMGKLSDWPVTDSFEADLEGYVWDQLYDDAEEVIARVCSPCDPPLLS